MVSFVKTVNAVEVRDGESAEVPLVAQQIGQQRAVGGAGHTVDGVIGSHDGESSGINSHAEWREEILKQVAGANGGIVAVLATLRHGISQKMFQRGNRGIRFLNLTAAEAFDHCSSNDAAQRRVFAHGLLDAAPARVAGEVEHRAIADVGALTAYFRGNHFAGLLNERGIPCGGHADAGGENGGPDSHVAVGSFFGNEHGDAEARILDGVFLQRIAGHGCQARSQTVFNGFACPGVGAVDGPEHAGATVFQQRLESVGHFDMLARANRIHFPSQRTEQLPDLFFNRHPAKQVGHSGFDRERGIQIVTFFGSCCCRHGGKSDDEKYDFAHDSFKLVELVMI